MCEITSTYIAGFVPCHGELVERRGAMLGLPGALSLPTDRVRSSVYIKSSSDEAAGLGYLYTCVSPPGLDRFV